MLCLYFKHSTSWLKYSIKDSNNWISNLGFKLSWCKYIAVNLNGLEEFVSSFQNDLSSGRKVLAVKVLVQVIVTIVKAVDITTYLNCIRLLLVVYWVLIVLIMRVDVVTLMGPHPPIHHKRLDLRHSLVFVVVL